MSVLRRIAAIDIGTVTTRLLVADVSAAGIAEVERSTDITHLGAGLTTTGSLAPDAMGRVETVIARYAERIAARDVECVSAVATSASRDAANGDVFRAMLASHGVEPRIIAGAREAELAFLGATSQRAGDGLLVVDCGGGSTELIFGEGPSEDGSRSARIEVARSIDVGSRRMTELHLASDPPTNAEIEAARAWATDEMRSYFGLLDERPHEVIGLAGTVTTLAAIKLGLVQYDSALVHGYVLSGSDISDILEMLAGLPLAARKDVVGLHPGRAGVIVAGALIMETVLALAGRDALTVSEHDILYGILLDAYRELQESSS